MKKTSKHFGVLLFVVFLFFACNQVAWGEDDMNGYKFSNTPGQTNTPPPTNTQTNAPAGSSTGELYKNKEKIPGFEATDSFIQYIENWYRFGIGIVAMLAVFMIAVGAFQYIIGAAGNAGKAGDGKDRIYSAIYGLVLALLVYLIFFLINPDILKGTIEGSTYQGGYNGAGGSLGGGTGGGGSSVGYKNACPDPSSKNPIDYSKATGDSNIKLSSNCNKYDSYFQASGGKYGVDPCVLKAVAMKESNCGANKGPSAAHACGLMQMLPSTAGVSCEDLMRNDQLSIDLAARYISQNQAKAGGAKNQVAGVFAGYNSGYGCSGSNGKTPSLCPSKDCPGSMAFECCVNPGGLDQSINYAWNAYGYYNQCKGN